MPLLVWVALAVLLLDFLLFARASYGHFSPDSASWGNTLLRAAFLICTAVLAVLCVSPATPIVAFAGVSVLLGACAAGLFLRAVKDSGSGVLHVAFTGDGPDRLITRGVYGNIRNPLYTAYLLYWLGWVVLSGFHIFAVIVFAGFLFAYLLAARDEESFLRSRFGGEYEDYCQRSWRFLPYLG